MRKPIPIPADMSATLVFIGKVATMKTDREPWDMEPHELVSRTIAAAALISYDSADLIVERLDRLEKAVRDAAAAAAKVRR